MNITVKCPLSKSISHWDILLLSVLPGMQCMAAKNQPVHFSPSIRWPKYWMLGTLMPWLYVHVFVVRLLGHFIIILKCSNVVHKLVPLPLTNDFPNLVSYLPSSFDYYSAFLGCSLERQRNWEVFIHLWDNPGAILLGFISIVWSVS